MARLEKIDDMIEQRHRRSNSTPIPSTFPRKSAIPAGFLFQETRRCCRYAWLAREPGPKMIVEALSSTAQSRRPDDPSCGTGGAACGSSQLRRPHRPENNRPRRRARLLHSHKAEGLLGNRIDLTRRTSREIVRLAKAGVMGEDPHWETSEPGMATGPGRHSIGRPKGRLARPAILTNAPRGPRTQCSTSPRRIEPGRSAATPEYWP